MFILLFFLFSVGAAIQCSYNGRNYQNGNTWIEQNSFQMRCTIAKNSWKVEITNCLTPEGIRVNVGSSGVYGNWEYHCERRSNGVVGLRQTVAREANCKVVYRYGSTWVERKFKFRCAEYGRSTLVGCIAKDGQTITADSTKVILLLQYECRQYSNGLVTFHTRTAPKSAVSVCFDAAANKIRQNNEIWWTAPIDNHKVQRKCINGEPTIIACLNDHNEHMPLGTVFERYGNRYSCTIERDGAFRYRDEQLGKDSYVLGHLRV